MDSTGLWDIRVVVVVYIYKLRGEAKREVELEFAKVCQNSTPQTKVCEEIFYSW
jgi:hypothetical protein